MTDYGNTPPPPPGDGGHGGSTPPPPPGGGSYGGSTPPPPPPPGGGGYDGGAYGAPPPPMGGGQIEHPKGMTILILGILSLVCCSPLGIAAFIMGNNALKEIDAQPGRYSNRQIVQIGRILGIIGCVLLVVSVIFLALGGFASLTSGSTSTGM